MYEFKVNRYITLKLENKETLIYINKERFRQCKSLLLNLSSGYIKGLDSTKSVDEIVGESDYSHESTELLEKKISTEAEFWGHCSNVQIWAENFYDTRYLHRNLAFPMLKKLADVGDLVAKKVFREEIAKRIASKYKPTITFLVEEGYLDYLPKEYVMTLIKEGSLDFIFHPLIEKIKNLIITGSLKEDYLIIGNKYLKYLDIEIILPLFDSEINFFNKIIEAIGSNSSELYEWGVALLKKVGNSISFIVKKTIIQFIEKNDYESLIKYIETPILSNLNQEDFIHLLEKPNINLLERILEGLRKPHIDSMFFLGKELIPKQVPYLVQNLIKKKVIEIIEQNDKIKLTQLIGLGLLNYLKKEDLKQLLKDVNFIKNYLRIFNNKNTELDNYKIQEKYYPNFFLRNS